MPTSLRQNMRMNPATAANTEARGISVSGPRYNCLFSVDVDAACVRLHLITRRLAVAMPVTPTRQRYCVYVAAGS